MLAPYDVLALTIGELNDMLESVGAVRKGDDG